MGSEPEVEVSLIIPAHRVERHVTLAVDDGLRYLAPRHQTFEVIVVPNGRRRAGGGDASEWEDTLRKTPGVRILPLGTDTAQGKGAALRHGFRASRGRSIYFTDADLPYDLTFFDAAAELLDGGVDLVSGNRRLRESVFRIPVDQMSMAYSRHRQGLLFNSVVRALLGLETSDTQAGIKAMTRRLAKAAFDRMLCPGFLFDLELFVTAREHGYAHRELPVSLFLRNEQSTVDVAREVANASYWLSVIAWHHRRGHYAPQRVGGAGEGGEAATARSEREAN